MKNLAAKEQKKKNSRILAALIFLLLLTFLGILNLDFDLQKLFTGFGNKLELATPLPENDPIPELTKLLVEQNIPIDFPLTSTESAIIAHLKDYGEIWFSPSKDFTLQVNIVQTILGSAKTEDKKIKRIDLRFERPSMVY